MSHGILLVHATQTTLLKYVVRIITQLFGATWDDEGKGEVRKGAQSHVLCHREIYWFTGKHATYDQTPQNYIIPSCVAAQ